MKKVLIAILAATMCVSFSACHTRDNDLRFDNPTGATEAAEQETTEGAAVTEPTTEEEAEQITQPTTEETSEQVTQPTTEETSEQVTQTTTEKASEQLTQPSEEAQAEQNPAQQEAITKANSYLRFYAYSRSAMIALLERKGFDSADAIYAADNCGADWNEQAVKKAKALSEHAATKAELQEQLEQEGFTAEQAAYGAEHSGLK